MEDLDPGDRRKILKTFIDQSKINETHLITALLVYLGYVDIVITTNFDPLITESLHKFGIDPTVIDITNNVSLQGHELMLPTAIYLHGVYKNVWQLNTHDELLKSKQKIESIFSQISINRTWVVVGYSGNDPVFDCLCQFEKFDEGLFWVGYKDKKPSKKVQENLFNNTTVNAHYIHGYDSDGFFSELFERLNINEPKLGHLLERVILSDIQLQNELYNSQLLKLYKKSLPPRNFTGSCRSWTSKQIKKLINKSEEYTNKDGMLVKFSRWLKTLSVDASIREIRFNIYNKKFQHAIELSRAAILSDPTNVLAYFYNGTALASAAETIQSPSDRLPYYQEMISSMKNAQMYGSIMESQPDEISMIPDVITSVWALEHNMGIEYLIDEENLRQSVPNPNQYAVNHFQNAVTVQPDSGITFSILGYALVQTDRPEEAIKAYETGIERMDEPAMVDYDALVALYLMEERYKDAMELASEASELYPDEVRFIEYQADAYLQLGQAQEGIDLVRSLVNENPNNPNYYMVLGTQLYQSAAVLLDQVGENYDTVSDLQLERRESDNANETHYQSQIESLLNDAMELEGEGNELAEMAADELRTVTELSPENDQAYNVLGIIYQNRASMLFDKRNICFLQSPELADQDQEAFAALEKAREYYEAAVEINPDDVQYWQALYEVYVALDMTEEADAIKKKLN